MRDNYDDTKIYDHNRRRKAHHSSRREVRYRLHTKRGFSMTQTVLNVWAGSVSEGSCQSIDHVSTVNQDSSLTPKPKHLLSLQEANEFALATVKKLPLGTTFTSKKLFEGVEVRGDSRRLGAVINNLRRAGLIFAKGITRDDQESRNGGIATLWEVYKDE